MSAVDVRYAATLHFHSTSSDGYTTYNLRLRIVRYLTIGDFEALPFGVPYCPIDPTDDLFILREVMASLQPAISEGSFLPNWNADTLWECPEDIKFDKATGITRVTEGDYIANSIIGIDFQSFYQMECYYIPVTANYSSVPDEMEGMEDKEIVPLDGAIFVPLKSVYNEEMAAPTAAYNYQYTPQFAWVDGYWAGIYAGRDLYPNHLLHNIVVEEPYGLNYRLRDPDHNRGITEYDPDSPWQPEYTISQGYHRVRVFYKICSPYPITYFPPRTLIGVGGGGTFIPGLGLLSQFGLNLSLLGTRTEEVAMMDILQWMLQEGSE